ncbi:hypothetical protein AVEN_65163-1 [Araneus ventricosus]|uniref:Uncharacterized protein n=1 Tax=Araneus ventricosus TaxID=182803 RepID=A0A4Y2AFE1_ARAVE|nr:hypothetical protein AVEN_65163-1 [Araneus ventricosus]
MIITHPYQKSRLPPRLPVTSHRQIRNRIRNSRVGDKHRQMVAGSEQGNKRSSELLPIRVELQTFRLSVLGKFLLQVTVGSSASKIRVASVRVVICSLDAGQIGSSCKVSWSA